MVEGLDMALDDIIKKKKQKAKANKADSGALGSGSGIGSDGGVGGGGAGRGYGPRPSRRFSKRGSSRMMPYTTPATYQGIHMREMEMVGGMKNENEGTMLHVSNLNLNVTHEDIKVLFSDVGDLKWYSIHYDGSGRPKGNADVVYERHSDALAAIRRYNNRLLDGNRLTLVLSNSDVVTSAIPPASHGVETQRWAYGSYWQHGLVQVQGRGKKRGHQPKEVSAEALDADLEKYREQAMFK